MSRLLCLLLVLSLTASSCWSQDYLSPPVYVTEDGRLISPFDAPFLPESADPAFLRAHNVTRKSVGRPSFADSDESVAAVRGSGRRLSAIPAGSGTLRFTQVTADAQFPPRYQSAVEVSRKAVSFLDPASNRRVSAPVGSLVLSAGGRGPLQANDVWLSTTRGRSWSLMSGVTSDGEAAAPPYDERSFSAIREGYSHLITPSGSLFRIGGQPYTAPASEGVWMSADGGLSWNDQAAVGIVRYPLPAMYAAAAVSTSKGQLLLYGGYAPYERLYSNTVYSSTDSGRNWKPLTAMPPFAARTAHRMVSWQSPSTLGGVDIVYMIAGESFAANPVENFNDVWASSDAGLTWAEINHAARFEQRGYYDLDITSEGVLIVSAGRADNSTAYRPTRRNDVWVSLDGGYVWGLCVEDAEWEDRSGLAAVVADDGFYYIIGGLTTSTTSVYWNDVWRSSISFTDHAAVSATCGVPVPACGVGLKCWPGPDTVIASDGSYVSCAACPHDSAASSSSSSSANGVLLPVLVVLVVFSVLVTALLSCLLYRIWMTGAASYLALPQPLSDLLGNKKSTLEQHSESLIGGTV